MEEEEEDELVSVTSEDESSTEWYTILAAIEEGWRQNQRQRSLRLFGGQIWLFSLPR